jgi:hypothetical protein
LQGLPHRSLNLRLRIQTKEVAALVQSDVRRAIVERDKRLLFGRLPQLSNVFAQRHKLASQTLSLRGFLVERLVADFKFGNSRPQSDSLSSQRNTDQDHQQRGARKGGGRLD